MDKSKVVKEAVEKAERETERIGSPERFLVVSDLGNRWTDDVSDPLSLGDDDGNVETCVMVRADFLAAALSHAVDAAFEAGKAERTPCPVANVPCAVHGYIHGKEAEELRTSIEQLLAENEDRVSRHDLWDLLDNVDARDSLAFVEAKDGDTRPESDDLKALFAAEARATAAEERAGRAEAALPHCFACLAPPEPVPPTSKWSCVDCGHEPERHAPDGEELRECFECACQQYRCAT